MKVFVNYPEDADKKTEFEDRVADFHATLLIKKIQDLHISDKSKKKVLDLILQNLKEKMYED